MMHFRQIAYLAYLKERLIPMATLRQRTTLSTASTIAGSGSVGGGATNNAPVWTTIPTITFFQGNAANVSVAAYATDPDGDPMTFTKNGVALPTGVTFDAAGKRFVYDGSAAASGTNGHILTADDGRP